MNVITIESEAFQQIVKRLEAINEKLNKEKGTTPLSDVWMDNQDAHYNITVIPVNYLSLKLEPKSITRLLTLMLFFKAITPSKFHY
jgi:hypothetical protein